MPACVSCPIDPVVDHLVRVCDVPDVGRSTLFKALARLADPRDSRGRRHGLAAILSIAACAVIAGARSYVAIAQWAAEAGPAELAPIGCRRCVPCESTIRRTLQRVDGDALDAAIGAWAQERTRPGGRRRFIAVDGKAIRGAVTPSGRCRMVMEAVDHDSAVVLGQVAVDDKTNEIPMFAPLLDRVDIAGAVITADALHVQRAHAEYLHRRGADYVLTVKANQPSLLHELTALPWGQVPASRAPAETGHGRCEKRTIKICTVTAGIGFPRAAQAFQITRKTKPAGAWTWNTDIVHGITSIPAGRVRNETIGQAARGHWTVENSVHWVRDVTFDEDRSQIRTANGPRVMASLRNLAISALRLAGYQNIATGIRHHATRSDRPITLLLTS